MDGDVDLTRPRTILEPDGRLTLSPAIQAYLDIRPGDELLVHSDLEGRLVIRRAEKNEFSDRLASAVGIAGPGPSTDEIMAMTRGGPDE